MATPTPIPGKGASGQFHPDAQGNYHTGNSFFDTLYKGQDQQMVTFLQNPEVAHLIETGGSGTVNKVIGDTDVRVVNGVITHTSTGGVWKPLLAAAAVAGTAGIAAYAAPAIAAAATGGGTAAATGTAATIAGTTAATGGTAALTTAGLTTAALKYGAPIAANLISSKIQSNAAKDASDAQQQYLQEALAYEKEKDLYQRGIDAAAVTKEATRYGDYQARLAPFIANGVSSNDRMAALLGLPARAGGSGGGSGGGDSGAGYTPSQTPQAQAAWAGFNKLFPGETLTPAMLTAHKAELEALGFTLRPNAAGEVGKIQYGTDRIADVIQGAGSGVNKKQVLYGGPPPGGDLAPSDPVLTARPPTPLESNPNTGVTGGLVTSQLDPRFAAPADTSGRGGYNPYSPAVAPAARVAAPVAAIPTGMVTVRAPNGQTKQVSASEAAHWTSRGATVLEGAA